MTPMQILFLVVALISLGSGLMVVTSKYIIHAALWLVLTLFGIAVIFVLLGAGFLAVAQVIIYIGAIAILMIFAVMLTQRVAKDDEPQLNSNWLVGALIAVIVFGGLTIMLSQWQNFNNSSPLVSDTSQAIQQLGEALVSPNGYVLPFEVASILLVTALIGAILIAWDKK